MVLTSLKKLFQQPVIFYIHIPNSLTHQENFHILTYHNPDKPETNPNSEIRNSKQIQMTKGENLKRR